MSMDDMVKVMTVEEMLLVDEVPTELFMEKLSEVNVNYLGPSSNLTDVVKDKYRDTKEFNEIIIKQQIKKKKLKVKRKLKKIFSENGTIEQINGNNIDL